MLKSDDIISKLDHWLIDKGETMYHEEKYNGTQAYENFILNPLPGIQQNKEEIKSLIEILIQKEEKNIGLEIGLGHYGSTHFIWRYLFKKTITIEADWNRVKEFGINMTKHYNNYVLGDQKSNFIHGFSYQPDSILSLQKILNGEKIDFLFIDGDHKYQSVMVDYLIYKNFIKKGGLICFHDLLLPMHNYGIKRFLNNLADGLIDNQKHKINEIVHSKEIGIAWIKV